MATLFQKKLSEKCIEFSSKPGDLVFDPFMGMGTTAVAAKGTWRHFFGFEINKLLKPIIMQRLREKKLGQDYRTLTEIRKKIIENAKKKYPKAYEIYMKMQRERLI